uniref:Opioid growth factor receptor (OGFr) conserved domain-containing protein n=1 Tax=Leptobrachium leishanense TaxID=445787 RepID=A0A8C5PM30_9ANUR
MCMNITTLLLDWIQWPAAYPLASEGNRMADQAARGAARTSAIGEQVSVDKPASKVLPCMNLCTQEDTSSIRMPNCEFFYMNRRIFEPNGEFIEVILYKLDSNYEILEKNHNYIQWLFPIPVQGRNKYAYPLNSIETEMMKNTAEIQQRLLRAYKMMLKFFGVKLVGEDGEVTGEVEVERAENFSARFDNLNANSHNNLRITRILKCLGELGAEQYQAPLVKFFLKETLIEKCLPNVKDSVLNYFMFTVKNKHERQALIYFAWTNYHPKNEFSWESGEELELQEAAFCDGPIVTSPAKPVDACVLRKGEEIALGRTRNATCWIVPNGVSSNRLYCALTV